MLEELKERLFRANLTLMKKGLAVLSGDGASAIDREKGLIVVKPADLDCEVMTAADMVVVDLVDGRVAEGKRRPSADTPAHLQLYNTFSGIGGIVHIRSINATAWAQAGKALPVYGTTHADAFYGEVPCTRSLTEAECVGKSYETNLAKVIAEAFKNASPDTVPAALVKFHGAFVWGESLERAVENAVALEASAEMAIKTLLIDPHAETAPRFFIDRHFSRKQNKKY